jgi:hypothetical protein
VAGAGGSSAGSGGVSTGGASGGTTGGGGAGGGTVAPCPADATFCSGFEEATMPAGAVYKYNAAPGEWTRDFEVDTKVFHSGKSALRVKAGTADAGSGAYQMLAVPAQSKFWARFYIRQDELDIGGEGHNVFGGAAIGDDTNAAIVEIAEDVGLAFNTSDDVRWPAGFGRINGTPKPYTLAKGQWHCIEVSFDSDAKHQQLFVAGVQIDATNYPANIAAFKNFKFGFNKLHGPARSIWYDDVAVGPTRPGCF